MDKNIKVIVFDFDGVLVDSEGLKRQAMKEIFMEYGEDFAQDIQKYQLETNLNRYYIADYAAWKLGLSKEWANAKADEYTKIVKEKIVKMCCMNTCESTLLKLVKNYPLYISSGTPTKELKDILVAKTMRHMFKGVYGGPSPKIDHFVEIIAKEKIKPEEILFIGDMEQDYQVARHFGLDFLAINYLGDKTDVREIEKLWNITEYLKL